MSETGLKENTKAKPHSVATASLAGLVLPGSGQAYNGSLFRGAFVLLTAPLVLPWIIGFFAATRTAKKINEAGGRIGFGGGKAILLHVWFAVNVALFVLLGLSMAGVLT